MTEFQARILAYVREHDFASTWGIAQGAFPEKWATPHSRGALIGNIDTAANKCPELIRLPPKDMHGCACFALRRLVGGG